MIERNEILQIAKNLNLRPDTVEKDYVLGWMLYGISAHPAAKTWAFKGGVYKSWRDREKIDTKEGLPGLACYQK